MHVWMFMHVCMCESARARERERERGERVSFCQIENVQCIIEHDNLKNPMQNCLK